MLISNPSSTNNLPSDRKRTLVEKWKNSKFFGHLDCCSDLSTNELIESDTSGSKFGGLGSMLSGSGTSGPFSRIKRFAISAEPTKYSSSANPVKDMVIKKIEKTAE